jgi:tetraacyldisaccharide 4'-kinase
LSEIQTTIRKLAPAIPLGTCDHAPTGWLAHQPPQSRLETGPETRLETMSGREAVAFAGIGNPQPFFDSLQQLGINLLATRQLPDHCPYDRPAVDALASWIEEHRRRYPELVVLCTHKDLVKLRTTKLGGCPLWALRIELEITSGEAELWRAVERVTACIGESPA